MRVHKLKTRARTLFRECARFHLVRAHLQTDLHEILNLSSQDRNWPPHRISWRSDLPLRRYLQKNIDFLNTLIFNVFSIFSQFHNFSYFGHISVKFCSNSMILDIFQQPRQWALQKCPSFRHLIRIWPPYSFFAHPLYNTHEVSELLEIWNIQNLTLLKLFIIFVMSLSILPPTHPEE